MDLHPTFVGVMELSMDEEAAGLASVVPRASIDGTASPSSCGCGFSGAGRTSSTRGRARSDERTWSALVRSFRSNAHGHPCRNFYCSAHCCFGSRRACLGRVLPGKPFGRVLSNPLQRLSLAIEYCTVDLMSESVSPSNQSAPTASP
jgi:hypothetical protein